MANGRKDAIITFKVDESLAGAMRGIPNRSEFIRCAILGALDSTCPVCKGTGMLTLQQREEWRDCMNISGVEKCDTCTSMRVVTPGGNGTNGD